MVLPREAAEWSIRAPEVSVGRDAVAGVAPTHLRPDVQHLVRPDGGWACQGHREAQRRWKAECDRLLGGVETEHVGGKGSHSVLFSSRELISRDAELLGPFEVLLQIVDNGACVVSSKGFHVPCHPHRPRPKALQKANISSFLHLELL